MKTNRLPEFTPKPSHIPKKSQKKLSKFIDVWGEKSEKNAKQCSDFTHSLLLSSDSDNFPFPQTLRLLRFSHFSEAISINRWRFNTLFVLKYLFFYRVIQASCCLALYHTNITIDYVTSSSSRHSRTYPIVICRLAAWAQQPSQHAELTVDEYPWFRLHEDGRNENHLKRLSSGENISRLQCEKHSANKLCRPLKIKNFEKKIFGLESPQTKLCSFPLTL